MPIFPLGTRVRLEGRGLAGAEGVVVDQDRLDPARPVVRLAAPRPEAPSAERIATVHRPDIELYVIAVPEASTDPGGSQRASPV